MSFALASAGIATFTSCEDMLDKGNSYVIYADTEHLTSSSDTVTSVVGILNKLQAIAVRNNLLGEVRADLVSVNENAIVDLKKLSMFEADVNGDDDVNKYNNPRDYYAIINNCNYFLDRVNDSLPEIHTDAMKYMFERETAAVHSIRAWTYLQCVLAYGKIPFVEKPVLTEADSKAQYPMYDLDQICDYFIDDLKPYVDVELPDYNDFDNRNVTPKMCFFPANLIMADLYLWKAALHHDPEAAKNAAKKYYDFIHWDQSGKVWTVTGRETAAWSARDLYELKELRGASGSFSFGTTGNWGATNTECITAIAMDSSSAKGYYNELRNIYNTTQRPVLKEASVSPSEALKALSQSQVYVGYDQYKDTVEVIESALHEDAIKNFYQGDLRFASIYSTSDYEYNEKEVKMQTITKHNNMNVMVYRKQQVFLRLAEALNYAGYPRFAKQILTMGLSNLVIQNEVQPYYTTPEDSAFIKYFDFNDTYYKTYAEGYLIPKNAYGVPTRIAPQLRNAENEANMWGIHGRGSGLPFINQKYLPVMTPDSTYAVYPQTELDEIGEAPVLKDYTDRFQTQPKLDGKKANEPSTWALYPNQVVDSATYVSQDFRWLTSQSESRRATLYQRYVDNDSVGVYAKYMEALAKFNAEMEVWSADTAVIMTEYRTEVAAYQSRVDTYFNAWQQWHNDIYSNPVFVAAEQDQVDQAILDEQALELAYEGNRFFDLMRRALWYGDAKRLNDPISEARPEVAGKLLDKKNWFLHYKGQIGW